ncbi:hypothetical protein HYALB_00013188 [Hymenoscyphus albidus]|uniref:Copper radical oxidase n=1 Tax=Hymenoscyphus albidus TaxID=595503 RepID=A0A9N9LWT8_9HELO|nr:hypothetical protein HYALB_00013188 [Hymenoscyphus albidus]
MLLPSLALTQATGFKTVGSSGVAAQMIFVPPRTNTVVFLDNYHANYGLGADLKTGAHSPNAWKYEGSEMAVFGSEYNLANNTVRALRPKSNTFCSAGAFFPNGTMLNLSGAEADWEGVGVEEGFDKMRIFPPGPCEKDVCTADWVELATPLQSKRWYPTSITMTDGSILVVGGSNKGGLVLNEASINVPTYEIIHVDGRQPKAPVTLPILEFTDAENLDPGKSYNLYPILHTLPNGEGKDLVFTIAGNRTVVWDYANDTLVKALPDTPMQPRTFPSSATSVLLPLLAPDYEPTVLVCGGSSGDMPAPKALDDCWRISPNSVKPEWVADDVMPNGAQTMTVRRYLKWVILGLVLTWRQDAIALPDGTFLFINGAHTGSAGGFQADDPVLAPMIYDPNAPAGKRFTNMPPTTIPRMYHSVATLLPSGEVLVAGSNPAVMYTADGKVGGGWPKFQNNGKTCALEQQQRKESAFPLEYRVEIFTPPYLKDVNTRGRPQITAVPETIAYGAKFTISGKLKGVERMSGTIGITLMSQGFNTHSMSMGQRVVMLEFKAVADSYDFTVTAPRDASVMPPGIYLLFVTQEGVPSEGSWINLA